MAGRNANGEGSISRRKDGRYEAAFSVQTISGKRKRIRLYGKTRAEAHKRLTEAKAKAQQGLPVADRTWRLSDYLNYWLEEIVKPNKRPATYAQCERTVRLYLEPGLGKTEITRLSIPAVQQYLNQLLSEGHSIPKTQVIRKVLSGALTQAMREELVTRNVARLTVLPTYEAEDREPWAAEEIRHFLAVSQTEKLYPAFVLLLLYGLRRGEVLGLRWRDIDFEQHVIHVRHQLQRANGTLQLGPLKTKAGRRNLALLHPVDRILLKHRELQLRTRSELTDGYIETTTTLNTCDLVFPAEHGKPMEASTLVRAFKRVCRSNGIREVRIHDARDSLATILSVLGIPVKQAQVILGHSKAITTLQHYQHGHVEKEREALSQVSNLFLPEKQKDDSTVTYYRLDGGRCRQLCRQAVQCVDEFTMFISGAGQGTLTPGLVLGKSTEATISDRTTEARCAVEARLRQWFIGIVAVRFAVKLLPPES
jgi:integrase